MLNLFVISIKDEQGQQQSYSLVTDSQSDALARARELAGVGVDAEFESCQRLHSVDEVLA